MNRNIALSLVLATAAVGTAFAADGEFAHEQQAPFTSTASRAQVQAELAQYRHDGIDTSSYEYNPLSTFKSSMTRAQVAADYIANRDEVAAQNGEGLGAETFAHNVNARSRDATRVAAGQPVSGR
jgi:hypothetical protein